jgi:hypothetical protein
MLLVYDIVDFCYELQQDLQASYETANEASKESTSKHQVCTVSPCGLRAHTRSLLYYDKGKLPASRNGAKAHCSILKFTQSHKEPTPVQHLPLHVIVLAN